MFDSRFIEDAAAALMLLAVVAVVAIAVVRCS